MLNSTARVKLCQQFDSSGVPAGQEPEQQQPQDTSPHFPAHGFGVNGCQCLAVRLAFIVPGNLCNSGRALLQSDGTGAACNRAASVCAQATAASTDPQSQLGMLFATQPC